MNMSDYKMIYKNRVYNVVDVVPYVTRSVGISIDDLEVIYINEDGELKIIEDSVEQFKFVRR